MFFCLKYALNKAKCAYINIYNKYIKNCDKIFNNYLLINFNCVKITI